MDTTFKKRIPWGHKDSYIQFQVKGYVLGDGQSRTAHRCEFSDFGAKPGYLAMRPAGKGTLNFEIAAKYVLYKAWNQLAIEEYKGNFHYKFWVDYSFLDADDKVFIQDHGDMTLGPFQTKEFRDEGSLKVRLTQVDYEWRDGTNRGIPKYFAITPSFDMLTESTTDGTEWTVGGGAEGGIGEARGNVTAQWTWTSQRTVEGPSKIKKWGSLVLALDILRIELPEAKQPPKLVKLPAAPLFTIIPFGKDNDGEDQRNVDKAGKDIAATWKRTLFQIHPELEIPIMDGDLKVYFFGYASKTGSDDYNYEIGYDRAKNVIDVLRPQLGNGADLKYKSYGEEKAKWGQEYDKKLKQTIEKVGKPRAANRVVIVFLRHDDVKAVLNKPQSR